MDMKQWVLFLMGMLCLFFTSCKHSMNYQELVSYISSPDNGLTVLKEQDNMKYKLSYRPASLMLYEELGNNVDSLYRSKEKAYNKHYYFVLNLSNDKGDVLYGNENFSDNISKFSFGLNNIAYLTTSENDTISLSDFYTPNLYGMTKSTSILLAFEKPDKDYESLKIHVADMGAGKQSFEFSKDDLDNVPQLKKEL